MPRFFFRINWVARRILPAGKFRAARLPAKHSSFGGLTLKIGCRVVQVIRFADGWGNLRLNWTTLHLVLSSVCHEWRCYNQTETLHYKMYKSEKDEFFFEISLLNSCLWKISIIAKYLKFYEQCEVEFFESWVWRYWIGCTVIGLSRNIHIHNFPPR